MFLEIKLRFQVKCYACFYCKKYCSIKQMDIDHCKVYPLFWINEIKKSTKAQNLNLSDNNFRNITDDFDCDVIRELIVSLNIIFK